MYITMCYTKTEQCKILFIPNDYPLSQFPSTIWHRVQNIQILLSLHACDLLKNSGGITAVINAH